MPSGNDFRLPHFTFSDIERLSSWAMLDITVSKNSVSELKMIQFNEPIFGALILVLVHTQCAKEKSGLFITKEFLILDILQDNVDMFGLFKISIFSY